MTVLYNLWQSFPYVNELPLSIFTCVTKSIEANLLLKWRWHGDLRKLEAWPRNRQAGRKPACKFSFLKQLQIDRTADYSLRLFLPTEFLEIYFVAVIELDAFVFEQFALNVGGERIRAN